VGGIGLNGYPEVANAVDLSQEKERFVLHGATGATELLQEVEVPGLGLLVAIEQAIS
jgi:hypothetical protein